MKKIVITIIIILYTVVGTGYAQFFKNQDTETGSIAGLNDSHSSNSDDVSGNSGFFRAGDATDPGNRPGNGEGIGQESEAPIKDGLGVLVTCSIIFICIKIFKKKEKDYDQ